VEETSKLVAEEKDFNAQYRLKIKDQLREEDKMHWDEVPLLLEAYENWRYNKQSTKHVRTNQRRQEAAATLLKSDTWMDRLRYFMHTYAHWISTPHYELIANYALLFNCALVVYLQEYDDHSSEFLVFWIALQILLNFIWLFELLSDISANGLTKAFQSYIRVPVEAVCQLLNARVAFVWAQGYAQNLRDGNFIPAADDSIGDVNWFIMSLQIIIFIRILKLTTLFAEIKHLLIIMETARNMIGPISAVFGVLLIIMYFYAYICMHIYGGKIHRNTECLRDESCGPRGYHLLNFNDLLSSSFTLWFILLSPFHGSIDMIFELSSHVWLTKVVFVSFYFFSSIIGLNLFIAQVLEMYNAVERLDNQK
jgi:hypothetical protein